MNMTMLETENVIIFFTSWVILHAFGCLLVLQN